MAHARADQLVDLDRLRDAEIAAELGGDLVVLQRAIRFGDGATLERLFNEARAVRRGIIQAGQDTNAPDFGRRPKTEKSS